MPSTVSFAEDDDYRSLVEAQRKITQHMLLLLVSSLCVDLTRKYLELDILRSGVELPGWLASKTSLLIVLDAEKYSWYSREIEITARRLNSNTAEAYVEITEAIDLSFSLQSHLRWDTDTYRTIRLHNGALAVRKRQAI